MSRGRETGEEKLSHGEWLEAGWTGAQAALDYLVKFGKENKLLRVKVGRPFEIELEFKQ